MYCHFLCSFCIFANLQIKKAFWVHHVRLSICTHVCSLQPLSRSGSNSKRRSCRIRRSHTFKFAQKYSLFVWLPGTTDYVVLYTQGFDSCLRLPSFLQTYLRKHRITPTHWYASPFFFFYWLYAKLILELIFWPKKLPWRINSAPLWYQNIYQLHTIFADWISCVTMFIGDVDLLITVIFILKLLRGLNFARMLFLIFSWKDWKVLLVLTSHEPVLFNFFTFKIYLSTKIPFFKTFRAHLSSARKFSHVGDNRSNSNGGCELKGKVTLKLAVHKFLTA